MTEAEQVLLMLADATEKANRDRRIRESWQNGFVVGLWAGAVLVCVVMAMGLWLGVA